LAATRTFVAVVAIFTIVENRETNLANAYITQLTRILRICIAILVADALYAALTVFRLGVTSTVTIA